MLWVTVWSAEPTTVAPAGLDRGERLAQIVVGLPDVEAEVVHPGPRLPGGIGVASGPTSISKNFMMRSARGEPGGAHGDLARRGQDLLPAEHVRGRS